MLTAKEPVSLLSYSGFGGVTLHARMKLRVALTALLMLLASVAIPIATAGTADAASCNTTATSSWTNNCTVTQGAHSNLVVAIQTIVAPGSYEATGNVLAIDGIFGPATKSAVQQWQTVHGLTADGIVGPNTWNAMGSALRYYTASGSYYYYISGAVPGSTSHVDFRENANTHVWQYGGPSTTSKWTTMNTSTPPSPVWVACCGLAGEPG